jgi:hypothetical protein
VGDPFDPERKETSLSMRATFIHFWEARRRLFDDGFVFTPQPWFRELSSKEIAPTKDKAERSETIPPKNPCCK